MDQQVLPILDRVDVELDDLRPALHDLAQRGEAVGRMGAGPREQTVVLEQNAASLECDAARQHHAVRASIRRPSDPK